MKKLLFLTGDQSRLGGTERICADVANMFSKKGFSVEILSLTNGQSSHFDINTNVKLSSVQLQGVSGTKLLFMAPGKLKYYFHKDLYDVVVVVESILFLFISPLMYFRKRPYVINWEHFNYDVDLGLRSRRIARWLAARQADHIVVLTHSDKCKWQKKLKISDLKISQIYNLNPSSGSLFKKSGFVLGKKNIVLAAGRLTYQKGFDLLIKAWSQISSEVRDEWLLKIVGEGEDRTSLEHQITSLGIEAQINMPGSSNDMISEYQQASVFVLSSRFEGFGLVLTEALTFNTPVISFDCPDGPSEIIFNEKNGLLVTQNDPLDMAKKLECFMVDESLRKSLTENSQMGLERFTEEHIFPKWLNLIEGIG